MPPVGLPADCQTFWQDGLQPNYSTHVRQSGSLAARKNGAFAANACRTP
jgi:hypothetical protein